MFYKIFI